MLDTIPMRARRPIRAHDIALGGSVKARLVASAALALGIVIGASGCSMITYQATTEHYDASDGVSVNVATSTSATSSS